jgi:hypothetical protein
LFQIHHALICLAGSKIDLIFINTKNKNKMDKNKYNLLKELDSKLMRSQDYTILIDIIKYINNIKDHDVILLTNANNYIYEYIYYPIFIPRNKKLEGLIQKLKCGNNYYIYTYINSFEFNYPFVNPTVFLNILQYFNSIKSCDLLVLTPKLNFHIAELIQNINKISNPILKEELNKFSNNFYQH